MSGLSLRVGGDTYDMTLKSLFCLGGGVRFLSITLRLCNPCSVDQASSEIHTPPLPGLVFAFLRLKSYSVVHALKWPSSCLSCTSAKITHVYHCSWVREVNKSLYSGLEREWLRALVTLAEYLTLVPSTHLVIHNYM